VNQQWTFVIRAPGPILDIFSQMHDRMRPRLPDRQHFGSLIVLATASAIFEDMTPPPPTEFI
jgi:hypothetical protein